MAVSRDACLGSRFPAGAALFQRYIRHGKRGRDARRRRRRAANTETYVAPKKYKTGTLNFDYDFKQQGNFIGLVKARSDDGTKEYVSRFPFAVGETASKNFYTALVLAAAGLVGFGLYYKHAFIDKKKPSA